MKICSIWSVQLLFAAWVLRETKEYIGLYPNFPCPTLWLQAPYPE